MSKFLEYNGGYLLFDNNWFELKRRFRRVLHIPKNRILSFTGAENPKKGIVVTYRFKLSDKPKKIKIPGNIKNIECFASWLKDVRDYGMQVSDELTPVFAELQDSSGKEDTIASSGADDGGVYRLGRKTVYPCEYDELSDSDEEADSYDSSAVTTASTEEAEKAKFNIMSIPICIILMILNLFYQKSLLVLAIFILLPIIVLAYAKFTKSLVITDLGSYFGFCSIGLFASSRISYHLIDYTPCVLAGIVFAVLIAFSAFWIYKKEFEQKSIKIDFVTVGIFFIAAGIYGYMLAIHSNSLFDISEPTKYEKTVVDKNKYERRSGKGGKHTSYYITVSPWSESVKKMEVQVPYSLYNEVSNGSTVYVCVHNGFLKASWYEITR